MAPAALPPDWNEMNAQRVSSLAEKVQSRMHTPFHLSQTKVPSGPVACLPKGIPPEIHFEAGRCVDSPMSALPPVTEDMDFCDPQDGRAGVTRRRMEETSTQGFESMDQ